MSDIETSPQEAAAAVVKVSDAPIDIDDLPSDAEASTSTLPAKAAGPGRPKGKSTTTAASTAKDGEQGLQSYLLPRSTITKIAKSAVPPNTKLQKELPTALTRSAVVFISYLTSLAQEQAAAANVKTIKPDHVLEALPELDWGEADTLQLRKHLKKQLKAYRAIAKAKKEGRPVPGPSTSTGTGTGRGRGRPSKKIVGDTETEAEIVDIDADEETASTSQSHREDGPSIDIQYKAKSLLKKPASGDEESSEEEDDVNVRKIVGDGDAEDEGEESPIEDDDEDEEQAEEDDEDEDLIDDAEEVDPNDFEEEMGQGLEDRRTNGEDQDMND